jgi:transcriptional regulator with XRE-family HTH domain
MVNPFLGCSGYPLHGLDYPSGLSFANLSTGVWLTPMKGTQSPEQVAGVRIREIRIARHLTQAALAKAMKALGYNWLQTTIAKVEAAERPLRLNEATDLAGVLGVEIGYLLTEPITGMLAVSQDFREMLRLQEIAEKLDAEVTALQQEFTRKQEDLILARQQIGEAQERMRAAGAVQDGLYWRFPKDSDG